MTQFSRTLLPLMLFSAILGVAVGTPVVAQSNRDREREAEANERDLERRSWNLRLLSDRARKSRYKQRPRIELALAQLQEDFTQLQIVNRALGRAAIGTTPLNLRFVSKSAAEIRKRAERLNDNLALPEPEKTPDAQPLAVESQEQLQGAVLSLVRLVFTFIDNPFFKEASVVDTRLSAKARRDLEEIIELSNRLKKDSESLGKAHQEGKH